MIRRIAVAAVLAVGLSGVRAHADTYYVSNGNEGTGVGTLGWAIGQANSKPTAANVIQFDPGVVVHSRTQYVINANVTINGSGGTDPSGVDMNGYDRAFFVVGGTVTFNNLTITNGHARGGHGGDGGGGGAGLGGGIFVADGTAMTGVPLPAGTANVTVSGVKFRGNSAEGGAGGDYASSFWLNLLGVSTSGNGGGGGLGGHGGASGKSDQGSAPPDLAGGGGGGGLMVGDRSIPNSDFSRGAGKDTANGTMNGALGMIGHSAGNGGQASLASGTLPGGTGGDLGGGGGGGNVGFIDDATRNKWFYSSGGGGGGINGQSAQGTDKVSSTANGAQGGFGGGGGGSGMLDTDAGSRSVSGGNGGWGGGGGGGASSGAVSFHSSGGSGGFGGGAGAGTTSSGQPGWGGGSAGVSSDGSKGSGGGGLGAGGAIFAMPGTSLAIVDSSFGETTTSFVNQAIGGAIDDLENQQYGASPGSELGSDLFLGANTTVAVSSALPKKFTGSLAGHGVAGTVPTLTKTGTGRLELHGSSALHTISLAQGTLAVGSGSAVGSSSGTLSFTQPASGTATLATVSETPGGPSLSLQVATIQLGAGTNVFEIGSLDQLSPNLELAGTRLVGPAPGAGTLAKAGSGVLRLGSGADLHQFTGTFDLREGTVINEASFGGNQLALEVASGAEMIVSASQLGLRSLGGGGTMTLQDGGRFAAHQAGGWSGVIRFENSASIEIDNGGGGRIDLAAGISGTMVESAGFNGTLSGAGTLILDTLSDVTLAKDASGFTGGIVVQRDSSLRLPSGFTGPGFIQGSGTSPAHLTVGGNVGNNLVGAFTTLTVDAPLPTTNLTVGALVAAPNVGTLEVANGRFRVDQVRLSGTSAVHATAAGAKHGTAVFNDTSPVAIGGNGTVEIVQFGDAVSLPGLAALAGAFNGTVHVTTGGTLTTPAENTVAEFQLDSGASLVFTAPGSTGAEFRGAGTVTATGTTIFSSAAPFADFTGRVDLGGVPEATINGALHTVAQVVLGPYTLSLAGDLDAPLQGVGPLVRMFGTAPAPGTTARIAARSFDGTTNASLDLNHAHFTADGTLAATVTVGTGALLETSGSIAKLWGSTVGTGTVRFTGVGDRTVGTDGGTDFGSLTLQLGATHLAILSDAIPLQSLANVQMGANSELRVSPSATIVSGNTLSATGAAVVHGAIANQGTIIGPSGFRTYLVFEDKVTGTGATSGHVKYNGGHNPGAATAGGLPGAPVTPSYHVTVVDGDLALGDRNTLQLDVGGYVRGISYDGVDVTGEIWLDGTLEIQLADGFMPDRTFTYHLIDAGSFFGQFSAFNLPSLFGGFSWDTSEVNSVGRLSVISAGPAPIPEIDFPRVGAAIALALGALALLERRGRSAG